MLNFRSFYRELKSFLNVFLRIELPSMTSDTMIFQNDFVVESEHRDTEFSFHSKRRRIEWILDKMMIELLMLKNCIRVHIFRNVEGVLCEIREASLCRKMTKLPTCLENA